MIVATEGTANSVAHAIDEAENEPDTEVILKRPESLLYSS